MNPLTCDDYEILIERELANALPTEEILFAAEGLRHGEIAAILGVPEGHSLAPAS